MSSVAFPLTVFLFSVLIILMLFLKIIKNYKNYWKSRSMPFLHPDLHHGNSRGMGRDYHAMHFMTKVYNELKHRGPIGGAFISTRPVAIVTDLDLVKNVLIKDFNSFRNRGIFFNSKSDPISEHISNVEDDQWKSIRSKLTPAFTSGKLKMMIETISEFSDKMVNKIEKSSDLGRSVELKDIMARFTCDVIGNVAFGIECNTLDEETSEFFQMAIKSMDSFDYIMRLVLNGNRKILKSVGVKLTPTEVSEFYMRLVKGIIEYRKNGNEVNRADLMNILIELKNRQQLPLDQVVGNAFFYFVAGYETTSTTLTFCLYELSMNPEIQELAREEVDRIMQNHGTVKSYDALQDLDYLEKVIKETLRKWPPSVSVQRETSEKYQVPNTKIVLDKHTPVIIPVYAIHHDPAIYERPDIFNPSRFDSENVKKRHPLSLLSFGDGPRQCPGIRFSMIEMKICLAKILMNFRLTLDHGNTDLPLTFSPDKFMICSVKGIYVKFEKL